MSTGSRESPMAPPNPGAHPRTPPRRHTVVPRAKWRLLIVDMISFGMIFLELVFGQLERLPGPGEEVFTDEFAISAGGAVTSATAAALGGVTAGVCTRLGDDLGSQLTIEHCAT